MLNGKILNTNRNTVRGAIVTKATADHTQIYNKGEKDQHPIEAITGLRAELDTKENNIAALETELEANGRNIAALEADLYAKGLNIAALNAELFDINIETSLQLNMSATGIRDIDQVVAIEGKLAKPTHIKGSYGYYGDLAIGATATSQVLRAKFTDSVDADIVWTDLDSFEPETIQVENILISYYIHTYRSKEYTVIQLKEVVKSSQPNCVKIYENAWWTTPLTYEIHKTNEISPIKTDIINLDERLVKLETVGASWFEDTTQDDNNPTFIKAEINKDALTFTKSDFTPLKDATMEYTTVIDHTGLETESFDSDIKLHAGELILSKASKTIKLQADDISSFDKGLQVKAVPIDPLDVVRKGDLDYAINQANQSLTTEVTRAKAEELRLTDSISQTAAALRSETEILATALDTETSNRISADSATNSKLTAEILRSTQKDIDLEQALSTSVAELNSIISTKISGEAAAREAGFTQLTTALNQTETELSTKINTEIAKCIDADTALRNDLTSEIINREDAIDNLQTKLDNESYTARNKESELDQKISTEVKNRSDADLAIYVALNAEKTERQTADNSLNETLTTKASELTAAIATEKVAREAAIEGAVNAVREVIEDVVEALNGERSTRETEDLRLAGLISDNADAIAAETEAREGAINTINGKLDVEKVSTAIATAKSEAIAAAKSETDGQVSALTEKVTKNTTDISNLSGTVSSEISRVEGLVTTEKDRAEGVEAGIIDRLEDVEAFFETTEEGTLDGALDTLKEIQEYLNNEGTATGGLIGRVSKNEGAIESLNNEVVTLKAADAAINNKIGEVADNATVVDMISEAESNANIYTDTVIGTWTTGTAGEDGYKEATGLRKEIEEAIAEDVLPNVLPDVLTKVPAKDKLAEALDPVLTNTTTIKTVVENAFTASYNETDETLTLTAIKTTNNTTNI